LIVTIFLALPLTLVLSSDDASAAITTITIKVEDKNLIVDFDSSNSTTYKGSVEVITTSLEPIMIDLRASYQDTLVNVEVEFKPQTMVFDINSKQNFDMKITLPEHTFAGHHYIEIGGLWKQESDEKWSQLEDLLVYVTVAQYFGISFEPMPEMTPYYELDRSEELKYKFLIKNEGNGDDTMDLDLLNEFELVNKNWQIDYNPFQFELSAFQSKLVELSLIPPSTNIPFETEIEFQLTSERYSELLKLLNVFVYAENGRYIITSGLSPLIILRPLDLTVGQLSTGDTVTVQVEARCFVDDARFSLNHDLYSQLTTPGLSGFDFQAGGVLRESGIEITISPSQIYLEPGQSDIFTIEITGMNDSKKERTYFEHLRLKVSGDNSRSNVISYEFLFISEKRDAEPFFVMSAPMQVVAVSSIVIFGIIAGIAGGTEFGKYSFLMLFIPLYTKLHKDKVLDHFTRGRIYEYIRHHPGAHFSELKRELKLTNGGLAYHLYTLEREELVRSFRFGKLKMFYTYEFGIPKEPGRQFSELEATILQIIDENPGISQREVGEMILNRNHRTVSHNIKQLARDGYLKLEKEGRSNNCFIDFSSLSRPEPEASDGDLKKGLRYDV
jgi:predicted transcriptional regulator